MNHDQANQLRQLVSERADGRAVVAVPLVAVGGSAGCGTTSIALNLAVALARQGRRAVFVDADLAPGERLRIKTDRDGGTIVDVLAGRRTLHEVLGRGPFGMQIVPGAGLPGESQGGLPQIRNSIDQNPVAQNRLISELERLAPHADVVVVDTGAARGSLVRRLWHAAQAVCVVTTPKDAAVLECYTTIKTLLVGGTPQPLYAIINRADEATCAHNVHARLVAACQSFLGVPLTALGSLPTCDALNDRFEPRTAAGGDVARLFDRAVETVWSQLQPGVSGLAPQMRKLASVSS